MTAGLRLTDVVVEAGKTRILDGVSLDVPAGRIVAVVGANGAGKTTLLDAISGVAPGQSGTVAVGGDTNGGNGRRRVGVGRVFQGSPLPETMTVGELAALVAKDRSTATTLLERFGLQAHASSFVAELSTGMRRIVDLAIATVGQPTVLLLDEPASGLAQSEIDHLATIVRDWRDSHGAAVILVEHDASLVKALADDVIVMEAGKIIAQGPVDTVLGARRTGAKRIRNPHDERFRETLDRIAAGAVASAALPKRTLSKWTLLRLGLREMAAGMASVLILGVLSRVLKGELFVSLGVVTAVLASYNLAAPIAVAIGHRSDTHPIFGRKRTPYIIAGAALTGLCVAAAPHVASRLAGGVTFGSVGFSVALFVAMGLGMYGSGTVFFALLTDRARPSERGHAASVVYLELMVGVLIGVALTGIVLKESQDIHVTLNHTKTLFGIVGLLVLALSTIAVWGQEKKEDAPPEEPARARGGSLKTVIQEVAAIPQARIFFGFMVFTTLFIFLQQAILTPFVGDVLGISIRGSTSFVAVMTIGTIIGMTVAGRPFAEQMGHRRVAAYGLGGSIIAFAALAAAAATASAPPAWLAILLLGLTGGVFNVSTLALLFGMSDARRVGLFMGVWTLAHALADGAATAGGGIVYEIGHRVFGSVPAGYAAVFSLEAIGLLACIPLLRRVDPEKFAREAAGGSGADPLEVIAPAAISSAAIAPAEPVAAEPVAAEPVAAEPVAAEPVAAEPVDAVMAEPSNGIAPPKKRAPSPRARPSATPKTATKAVPKAATTKKPSKSKATPGTKSTARKAQPKRTTRA